MNRWIVWFAAGGLLWLWAFTAFAYGVFERYYAIGLVLSFACVGWFVITAVAVPIKLIVWLVRSRERTE